MMVHPYPFELAETPTIAAQVFDVDYYGKGRMLRRFRNWDKRRRRPYHRPGVDRPPAPALRPTDRIHGIVTRGGEALNIVPAHTSGAFMARGRNLTTWRT
jgi:hypothetical protein